MYGAGRAFVWPPQEDGSSTSQHRPPEPPNYARPGPAPPPPPPPGPYRPAADQFSPLPPPHQPYGEPDLSAVRAFVQVNPGQPGQTQRTRDQIRSSSKTHASNPDSPSQQLLDAANRSSSRVGNGDDDMDDDDDDEPVADPGAPEPTTVDTDNPMPPPPAGSIYASRDDLLRSANTHARQYGYALSIKKSTASGQKSIIVCTREGRPMNNHHLTDETRVRKGRVSKRSGCKMKIAGNRIRRMRDDGMGEEEVWRLRVIHGEHNHGPDDPKMNPIHRKMADEVKEAIVKGLRRGLKVRKIYDELVERWPDLSATKQDVRNEVGRIRKAQVDLTPADEDVEEIRQRQEDQAQRQRDGARNALPRPNEQDRSVMALLRMEKEALEAEVRTLKEGASRAANAEVNAENARLKSEVETLKKDLDREKKEVEAGKTRLDELRSVVDRYLLQNIGGSKGAQTPPQTQQQQQVQQPQTASPQFGNVGIQSAMQMPNHSQYPSAAVNQGYGAPQPGRGSSRMMGGMGDGWHR